MNPLDESLDVRQADTINEMRAEIFRLSHINPLVRNAMREADYCGARPEARYIYLAYTLLRQNNQMSTALLLADRLDPSAIIVTKDAAKDLPGE